MRFSQALGFEGYPELQGAAREEYRRRRRAPGREAAPLFSLDQSPFETALAADHVNVEETARKVSRSQVEAAVEAIARAERVLHRRHRPDGVLRLLPAPPADAARPARRGRRAPSQEALGRLSRIDEHTLVIGLSAGRPHPLVRAR